MEEKAFYKEWWFWLIVAIIAVVTISIFYVNKGIGSAGISQGEFDEISLGMTQFKVDEIIDSKDEWDDETYEKCCEKISEAKENSVYTYVYKYYGERSGYAIITYEVDYSEGFYTLKYPKVVKKEKFNLK